MQFTTAALTLTLALTASATPLKRQTPSRFALFFAATDSSPETELLVTEDCGQNTPKTQCIVANPTAATAPVEPLILDSNFVFTSVTASPTGGQALIVDTVNSQPLSLTVPHSGFVVPANYTQVGFSVIDGVLAFNGRTDHFYQCLEFVAPGGTFPLYAVDPIDLHALGGAGCVQRQILAKTSAVGK